MYIDPRPIDIGKDADLRITQFIDYGFCADQASCLLGLTEIVPASREFPVLFAVMEGGVAPVALLSTNGTRNMAVEEGQWRFGYVPAVFRTYPFLLMQTDGEGNNLAVCLERTSPQLVRDADSGTPIFEDGEPTDFLKNATSVLTRLHEDQQQGLRLGQIINEKKLFSPFAITTSRNGTQETTPLDGFYFVNEKALNELSDEAFLDLKKSGVLPAIYAHLISLGTLNRIHTPAEFGAE